MSTGIVIEECFKELVCELGYEKLTVQDICNAAHISRKTFYVYFHGKEDVVQSYFKRNSIESLRFLHETLGYLSPEELMRTQCSHLYHSVRKDGEFYMRLVGEGLGESGGVFVRSVTNAIHAYNMETLNRMQISTLEEWEFDYVAYFFASSQAMLMKRWIQEGMEISPAELGNLYIQLTSGFWLSLGK